MQDHWLPWLHTTANQATGTGKQHQANIRRQRVQDLYLQLN